ncbi:MAG: hypothetical protein ABWY04_08530 [Arthrobacter sp.]
MEFTRQPISPVYARQEVTFGFQLEAWERLTGDYDFQILDSAGKPIPFTRAKGGILTHKMDPGTAFQPTARFPGPGVYRVRVKPPGRKWALLDTITVDPPAAAPVLKVALQTGSVPNSSHAVLWEFIEGVTKSLTFTEFEKFATGKSAGVAPYSPYGSLTYDALHRLSTDFVTDTSLGNYFTSTAGTKTATATAQSYVKGQIPPPVTFPLAVSGQYPTTLVPFVELIYVYWLEEGMLFQSLNRILARFQNRRSPGGRDPLSRLAVSPLLPLRGLLWGLAEAEKDRLSLRRRAAEYEYQYGLQLIGRAVPPAGLLVERRTQFLEAFHSLLNACYHFYREDSDKTVDADAFPLLSNLRELHLVLAHGANNQFTDVSLAARIETLDVQWMLAQPEMQEFLGGRTMVPYDEKWMSRVDTMKSVQGWSDTSVTHFYDLAVHGEQLLLSVRHGQWNSTGTSEDDAKNWAKNWKQPVQRYIHAYRAVTGVDLSERVDTTMPSALLQRRLNQKLVGF